jgi:hypothetical protein
VGAYPRDTNRVYTTGFLNSTSYQLYATLWKSEPDVYTAYHMGKQCGACSFYGKFNTDWGLCCYAESRHYLETVFEHFSCPSISVENWGCHSFTPDRSRHCRCEGWILQDADAAPAREATTLAKATRATSRSLRRG